MIDWNKIEEKMKTLSIPETFEKHLDPKELAVIRNHIKRVKKINSIYMTMLLKIKWPSISKEEESLLKLTTILFLTEGALSFLINSIIYTLILKGHHDIWFEQKYRFVSSFDELFDVPLAVRLKFLEKHDLDFSEICPKNIRNAIAHLSFNVASDGTIQLTKGKKYTPEQLELEIFKATKIIELVGKTFE